MRNFVFHNPTKVIFGRDTLSEIGGETAPYGKNVLLVYGKGSIKRSHDWIFCEDARNAGIKVFADNSLGIKHIGQYEY